MPKLTDTQRVALAAAARRDSGVILPLPKALKLQGGAVSSVLKSLLKRSLIAAQPAAPEQPVWRTPNEDGPRQTLVITEAGLQAIGIAPADKAKGAAPDTRAAAVRSGTKQAGLIDLLRRREGATLAEAVAATGWQPHSVRGAISGTLKKKLGLAIASETIAGRGRVYRIVP